MRYFLETAYKGTAYHGWQIQKNAITVQGLINEVLSKIAGYPIETTGSGRTDTGVHAEQQFFHLDIEKQIEPHLLMHKLNTMLPRDIAIKNIYPVQSTQHARFDAISRSYQYRISRNKEPLLENRYYHFTLDLDLEQMNKAAALLLRWRNFECFSKVKTDVDHFECDITQAFWEEHNELLIFYVSANRFLRGMVRTIVGTLIDIGLGKTSIQNFHRIIEGKNRKLAGTSVPAQGLFLTQVCYPDNFFSH